MRLLLWGVLLFLNLAPNPVSLAQIGECGEETACTLEDGEYFIHLPNGADALQPKGAIFFLHGYKGNAVNEIRNKSFKAMADELGVAFIAIQGIEGTWSFPSSPRDFRNEFSFFESVLEDVSQRFGVDRSRTMLSGFSSGAFMTWYTACNDARMFAGYAPIAGAFWKPLPETCPSSSIPYLFHVHGTSDKVVPLEGRPLWDGRWHQGDVFKSFDVWKRQADMEAVEALKTRDGELNCERWNTSDGVLELCLHEGGHSVKTAWLKRAWKELAKARAWPEGEAGVNR